METATAMFAITSSDMGSVECRIGDKQLTLPRIGLRTCAHVGNWLNAFYLAAACRDGDRITELCGVSVDALRSVGGADEFLYLWAEILQAFWTGREGLEDKFRAVFEVSAPEVAIGTPRELLQFVLYPPIDVLYRYLFNDVEAFNESLAWALELHALYWTSEADRIEDVAGGLSLPLLALACFAFDAEIPVAVESGYLPKYLMNRAWFN